MSISLRQIRYFVATAHHGQISQAATELEISQSAITAAIKDLEADVGVTLFRRSQRGMDLTVDGRRFLGQAREILDRVREARDFRMFSRDLTGAVTLGAPCTIMGYFLPTYLGRLRRAYPGLNLQLAEQTRAEIEDDLIARRLDMAILPIGNVLDPSIATETLLSLPRRLWTSTNNPLLAQDSIGLQEIQSEPYLMLTADDAASDTLEYWNQAKCRPNVIMRTSSIEAVRSMVANGDGVTILSDLVHRPWSLEGKRIETVVPTDTLPTMDIGLAWAREFELNPQQDSIRAYFRQVFQNRCAY